MRYEILSVALLLLLSASFASAISYDLPGMKEYADAYNSKIDKAPEVLKGLLGNERINLEVIRNDGSVFRVGFEVEKARINGTVDGGLNDPTIIVTTTESAIDRIRMSDDPIAAFQKERDLGQVNIQETNPLTGAKLEAVISSTIVLQFFYSILFG
jgi:hypothetical protein